jgi:hypothetical protein
VIAVLTLAAALAAPPDTDRDGLSDALEARILHQFAPRFLISRNDCAGLPSEFDPKSAVPRPLLPNGTIYGRVTPLSIEGRPGQFAEVQYYHLWARDCGPAGHDLDAEHVSALVQFEGERPQALYWYSAAHESTLCDRGHGARAAFLGATQNGPAVWVSYGKHASYLSERLCSGGCGGDQCKMPTPAPRAGLVNLGEPDAPLLPWLASKLGSDFPPAALAELDRDLEAGIVALNSGLVPVRAVMRAGLVTGQSLSTANRHTGAALETGANHTGGALETAHRHVDNSLLRSYRATRNFLGGGRAGPWISLFDGRTLKGWITSPRPDPPPSGWIVEKGTIRTTPGQGYQDYLVSERTFTNFEFRFDWKVEKEANSGVKYRAQGWWSPKGGIQAAYAGMEKFEPAAAEYQIADDEHNPDALSNPKHSAGALYEFAAPRKEKPARANQWHSARLIVRDTRFEHWLDGKLVAEGDFLNPELIQSKTRRGTAAVLLKHERRDSPLILQFHNGVAWFRNLKVRTLP